MYAFFVLQCTVFGRRSKHKTAGTAWHGIHFHKNNQWNVLVKGTIVWIIKIKYFVPPRILDEHWCIYSCLQIPPRENWFQYLRRVYTTAINFPCISTLVTAIFPWRITWNYAYSPSLNIVNYFSYLLLVRPGRLDINGSVRTKKWYSIFKLKDSSNMSI